MLFRALSSKELSRHLIVVGVILLMLEEASILAVEWMDISMLSFPMQYYR